MQQFAQSKGVGITRPAAEELIAHRQSTIHLDGELTKMAIALGAWRRHRLARGAGVRRSRRRAQALARAMRLRNAMRRNAQSYSRA